MTVSAPTIGLSAIDLVGKRVLITGGTKGIGAAIAAHATQAGADVLVAARTRSEGVETARFLQADVSTSEGVSALAEQAITVMGGVDVLVDNVGNPTHPPAAAWDMSDQDWLGVLTMNLMSAVRLDRAVIPGMIERGSGAIIHISSVVSRIPAASLLPYSAAKAALNSYSKGLSTELAAHGIRVNAVLPGLVETAGMTEYLTLRAAEAGTDIDTARRIFTDGFSVPMGHTGHVDDVARLVIFLASNHARYITGGQYTVDGGMMPSS